MSIRDLQNVISVKFTEKVLIDIIVNVTSLSEVKIESIENGAPSKKGDAYLSNIYRFVVNATGKNSSGVAETASVPIIVKYLLANIARRKTFRSVDFFENESIFYKQVWSAFQKFQNSKGITKTFDNIPQCVSSCIDGENDYIAMIDLTYEGYQVAERGAGLGRDYTLAILRVLGGFHALSLAFKQQQPEEFEKAAASLKETYFSERLRPWYTKFQNNIVAIVRDAVEKELPTLYQTKLKHFLEGDLYGRLCQVCQTRGPLAVVCHGDVWTPNFLPKYDGARLQDIKMIDFQLTRYASLTTDLMFFLYSCVDFELMEREFDQFIIEYHKALVEHLERFGSSRELVSLQDIYDEIKNSNDFGIGMSMEAIIMSLLDDDDVSDLDDIQGTEAVPLESVWLVYLLKEPEKRRRLAGMIKFAVDRGFM